MVQARFVSGEYEAADYVCTADITAGDVIVTADTVRIAHRDFTFVDDPVKDLGALAMNGGTYEVMGDAAIAADKLVYWNNTTNKVTESASGKVFGVTVTACAADEGLCNVRHDPAAAFDSTPDEAPGASTAAAGTTTADAGVLPAATSEYYPTTAADDTKGVRVNAADKVTGRTLRIGNGVANKILKVYAPSGGTINGAAADAAFSSASGGGVIITCLNSAANTWNAW